MRVGAARGGIRRSFRSVFSCRTAHSPHLRTIRAPSFPARMRKGVQHAHRIPVAQGRRRQRHPPPVVQQRHLVDPLHDPLRPPDEAVSEVSSLIWLTFGSAIGTPAGLSRNAIATRRCTPCVEEVPTFVNVTVTYPSRPGLFRMALAYLFLGPRMIRRTPPISDTSYIPSQQTTGRQVVAVSSTSSSHLRRWAGKSSRRAAQTRFETALFVSSPSNQSTTPRFLGNLQDTFPTSRATPTGLAEPRLLRSKT
jgi:hypothetical protein